MTGGEEAQEVSLGPRPSSLAKPRKQEVSKMDARLWLHVQWGGTCVGLLPSVFEFAAKAGRIGLGLGLYLRLA